MRRILIACEYSGRVREAFRALGHDAWSCDLLPTEQPGNHIIGNVLELLEAEWDLMIGHPPCTHLCISGARWFKFKQKEQRESIDFVMQMWNAPIQRICLENPIGILKHHIGKPTQIIQPWQFGHGETKATCLWLKGLPPLKPTNIVSGREPRIHWIGPGKNRSKERSRTYQGIADAMAEQWSNL